MAIDSLYISKNTALSNLLSTNTALNPDSISGNGTTGFTSDTLLYVGNLAASGYKYDTITVTEQNDLVGVDVKYSISSFAGAANGPVVIKTAGDYITPGNYVNLYRRVVVAAAQPAQHITNIKHRLSYTEHAV